MGLRPGLGEAMKAAAMSMSLLPDGGNLLSTSRLVTGEDATRLRDGAFDAVDMEAALVAKLAPSFAVVRVILDSADHPISGEWLRPAIAMRTPTLWSELWQKETI